MLRKRPSGFCGSFRSSRTAVPMMQTRLRVFSSGTTKKRPRSGYCLVESLKVRRRRQHARDGVVVLVGNGGAEGAKRHKGRRHVANVLDSRAQQAIVAAGQPVLAALKHLAERCVRRDGEAVAAQSGEILGDRIRQALHDRDHGDDGGDADNDAERRQDAAKAVCFDVLPGGAGTFDEIIHRRNFPRRRHGRGRPPA